MVKGLTDKQRQVEEFIRRMLRQQGYPPSFREISEELGLSGPHSVKKILDSLEKKGRLTRQKGRSRAIELTEAAGRADFVQVPLVGRVRAGKAVLAVEDILDYYSLDRSLCRGDRPFLLRVQGDSMKEASILDGDLVLVRPQPFADNGEIVVALIGEEATVKRFFREAERILLKPENPDFPPIEIAAADAEAEAFAIVGKVTAVIRELP